MVLSRVLTTFTITPGREVTWSIGGISKPTPLKASKVLALHSLIRFAEPVIAACYASKSLADPREDRSGLIGNLSGYESMVSSMWLILVQAAVLLSHGGILCKRARTCARRK